MKFIMNNKRLIFIFIFSLLVYEVFAFSNNNNDPIAMYAFSHAIRIGQVPYLDFNIISTPLYAFLMSIGLFIFDNYLMFIIEQSFLVVILFYFLFKLFDKKAWFILLGMVVCSFFGFLPTYNFLCFLFLVILVYLEKEYPEKDYLIGLILGLSFLSKHTVGIFLVLTTIIINYKNIVKLVKRAVGFLIPCLVLLLYLIVNKALISFIDLVLMGLFDFGGNNSNFSGLYFYLAIILLFSMIYLLYKNKNNKYNYYLLCGFMFCIPLFDLNHFSLLFNCFVILLISCINLDKNINFYSKLSIFISLLYGVLYFICSSSFGVVLYSEFNHFNYMINFKSDYENNIKVNKFLDKYSDKNVINLSSYSMFYNIIRDRKINYFDVLLYGNHGYNGTSKMINKIKDEKDVYIIVDLDKYENSNKSSQYNKKIVKYVLDNFEIVDSKYSFNVYYKE